MKQVLKGTFYFAKKGNFLLCLDTPDWIRGGKDAVWLAFLVYVFCKLLCGQKRRFRFAFWPSATVALFVFVMLF